MSNDDMETECMNELFDSGTDDYTPSSHWRPVAITKNDKEKQLNLIKEQKGKDR